MPQPDRPPVQRPRPLPTGTAVLVGLLLAIPMIGLAVVPLYSRTTPVLFGFPFFYWYQFLWVLISAVLTLAAYVLVRRLERPRPRLHDRDGGPR